MGTANKVQGMGAIDQCSKYRYTENQGKKHNKVYAHRNISQTIQKALFVK